MLLTLWGSPVCRRGLVIVLSFAALALVWALIEADHLSDYGSRDASIAAQKQRGYLLVGTLASMRGPALVVTLDRGHGGVEFVSAAGKAHRYQGFTGPMKALHLRRGLGADSGFTMVFHRPVQQSAVSPVSAL